MSEEFNMKGCRQFLDHPHIAAGGIETYVSDSVMANRARSWLAVTVLEIDRLNRVIDELKKDSKDS